MIKYIHLNKQFDTARLKQEAARLEASLWKNHYNQSNYEGNWSTLQLRSINGQAGNNIAIQQNALQGGQIFEDTPLLARCPYIAEVIDFFKMDKTAVRLMKLDAGAVIKPHKDHDLNFEQGEVRLHIPVSTNANVKFLLQEEQLHMQEGSCWYLNLSLTHSVQNEGNTHRVHLVIDGIVNDWLKEYFSSPQHRIKTYEEALKTDEYSIADKLKIIEQLRLMQTAVANKLADDMLASLQQPNT